MGWTSVSERELNGRKAGDIKDFIIYQYERYGNIKVVSYAKKESTIYMALTITNENHVNFGEIVGEVVLTSFHDGEFYWNSMGETMGPCKTECPKRIINQLSPTDNEYALNWRKACLQHANKRKPKHGDIIEIPKSMTGCFINEKELLQANRKVVMLQIPLKRGAKRKSTVYAIHDEQTSLEVLTVSYSKLFRHSGIRQMDLKIVGRMS